MNTITKSKLDKLSETYGNAGKKYCMINTFVYIFILCMSQMNSKAQSPSFKYNWYAATKHVGADPETNYFQGKYYTYTTGFHAYSSEDMVHWKYERQVFNLSQSPWADNNRGHWAPSVLENNGKYYFYYSVGPHRIHSPAYIGVAVGNSPLGPFNDIGSPMVANINTDWDKQIFSPIDPHVFKDDDGRIYMVAGGYSGTSLRMWELNKNNPTYLARFIGGLWDDPNGANRLPGVEEGAFIHKRNGWYYLTYSVGSWTDNSYHIRYAMSRNINDINSWRYKGILMSGGNSGYQGTGHNSVIRNHLDGLDYLVYHRWEGGNHSQGGARKVAMARIWYNSDGTMQRLNTEDIAQFPVLVEPSNNTNTSAPHSFALVGAGGAPEGEWVSSFDRGDYAGTTLYEQIAAGNLVGIVDGVAQLVFREPDGQLARVSVNGQVISANLDNRLNGGPYNGWTIAGISSLIVGITDEGNRATMWFRHGSLGIVGYGFSGEYVTTHNPKLAGGGLFGAGTTLARAIDSKPSRVLGIQDNHGRRIVFQTAQGLYFYSVSNGAYSGLANAPVIGYSDGTMTIGDMVKAGLCYGLRDIGNQVLMLFK